MTEEGMSPSIRCQFCGDFGEKAEPYICPLCKEKIKQAGYVQLAPDQSLPSLYPGTRSVDGSLIDSVSYHVAQQDMKDANFKKVKQSDKI